MANSTILVLSILCCVLLLVSANKVDDTEETVELPTEEEIEYAKGPLCQYCDYCKFCKLCDADCPCETSPTKPNCDMCKYCKFCYLCKACDTVCQPGGIIDSVTTKLFSVLPSYDKSEVDSDIDSMKEWIDRTKDEL